MRFIYFLGALESDESQIEHDLRTAYYSHHNPMAQLILFYLFQFDQLVRSLNIDPDSPTFRIITDGQLPLRQCLHPEACAKDIELPNYYCKFSDLRKEFVRYKSAGLSRALIPVKDIKNLPNMPQLPALPASIAEMMEGKHLKSYTHPLLLLNIKLSFSLSFSLFSNAELKIELTGQEQEDDFYIKESQDMITVIQKMLSAGKFGIFHCKIL